MPALQVTPEQFSQEPMLVAAFEQVKALHTDCFGKTTAQCEELQIAKMRANIEFCHMVAGEFCEQNQEFVEFCFGGLAHEAERSLLIDTEIKEESFSAGKDRYTVTVKLSSVFDNGASRSKIAAVKFAVAFNEQGQLFADDFVMNYPSCSTQETMSAELLCYLHKNAFAVCEFIIHEVNKQGGLVHEALTKAVHAEMMCNSTLNQATEEQEECKAEIKKILKDAFDVVFDAAQAQTMLLEIYERKVNVCCFQHLKIDISEQVVVVKLVPFQMDVNARGKRVIRVLEMEQDKIVEKNFSVENMKAFEAKYKNTLLSNLSPEWMPATFPMVSFEFKVA